ncbi:MAG: DNA mismatch repair protein MutS, partial [Halobaculum sp.]
MVTGAPATLRERREELTPMLSQYVALADEYDDAVLLFRVGDFYKAFCETAEEVARICELTLIEREDSTGTYAACGIPIDNPATYLERLLEAGHRLAIADQVEDPEETTGLVDRAVTRVVTPGTVVDDELLAAGSSNYLACVVREGGTRDDAHDSTDTDQPTDATGDGSTAESADEATTDGDSPAETDATATTDSTAEAADAASYGLAYVDVSTGECATTSGDRAAIREELTRIGPAECLPGPGVSFDPPGDPTLTAPDEATVEPQAAHERVAAYTTPERFEP